MFRVVILFFLLQIFNAVAGGESQSIGNRPGQLKFADGPGSVFVNVGDCRFSMMLARDDHVQFNGPEAIFYHSKDRWSKNRLPYLDQARMSVGYDWSFKKGENLSDQWFGVMCDDIANFAWGRPKTSGEADISPELAQIFEANSSKCPANLLDGRWNLRRYGVGFMFREVRGRDWSGFVVGYKSRENQRSIESLRFCLVHNDRVVIGASENDIPMNIDDRYFYRIVDLLSTVEFRDK